MEMWIIHKMDVYQIIESETKNIVVTGLEEGQAQTICDHYNKEIQAKKWGKEGTKDVKE